MIKWQDNIADEDCRKGIRIRFDGGVNPDMRKAYMDFTKWLRKNFYFPLRINVYVNSSKRFKSKDGEMVVGIFLSLFRIVWNRT